MDDVDLMIEVDWPEASWSDGRPVTGMRGLLSCGHYARPVHAASSTWDFPHDPQTCPECGREVQFDLRLQAAILLSWEREA